MQVIVPAAREPLPNPPRRWRFIVCLLLVLATSSAFWPVTQADFINYDDQDYVTENPMVLNGLSPLGVQWAFTTGHATNWHPLTWLSHMLDVTLFGKGPTGPHCVNLTLHVLNSLLVLFLFLKLTGAFWRGTLLPLFALHPVHVESVACIAERKDVLSMCFGLSTLVVYRFPGAEHGRPPPGRKPQFTLWRSFVTPWG